MDLLSPLDAAFLEAEDAEPATSMAIGSIAVFDKPAPGYEEVLAAIAGRLPLVPKYRQKVRSVPLRLGAPRWVDDPRFDLSWHVRETALPRPGGDKQLRALMGRVMGQRLDRDRPLWEYWLVQGLRGGRWALISKVHHCMVDGVSGTDLYRVLLDPGPQIGPAVPDDWRPAPEPSDLRLAADAARELAALPFTQARGALAAAARPLQTTLRLVATARGLPRYLAVLIPAARTSLNGPIHRPRRFTWARTSLDDIKLVRHQLGGTVNDVVLAAITGGLRGMLLHRGEAPGPHSVRSLVPVSVRAPGERSIYDNRVSAMLAFLPVDVEDPVQRLAAVRRRLTDLKRSGEVEAGEVVTSVARSEPFPMVSVPVELAFHYPQAGITTVTTNVPGPRFPLYGLGRRVLEIIPYVPIADRVRVGVAIFSYCGDVTFGVTGDYDTATDIDVLAKGIENSVSELVQLARARGAGEPAGTGIRR